MHSCGKVLEMSSLMSSRLDSLSEEPTSARHFSTLKKTNWKNMSIIIKFSLETPPSLSVSVKSVAVLFHFSLARDRQMLYNSAQTHKQQHSEVNVRDWRDAQVWRLWNVNVINGQKALSFMVLCISKQWRWLKKTCPPITEDCTAVQPFLWTAAALWCSDARFNIERSERRRGDLH